MTHAGRCLCRSVRYEFDGEPGWVGYCHCDSCRRTTSSPTTVFMEVSQARFRWKSDPPAIYENTPGARRYFCKTCGSPMAFEADWYPGVIHLYPVSLEDPSMARPVEHVHAEERLPWFDVDDSLPRTAGFGGTGQKDQSPE
ncbi:GFA family protein [Roseovarius phycicola]|uniref:GFA family protein n=1 Tax=Roseovarius phycicola TaxID=3080976 RepID=A0ABZ2HIK1_9RHOB